MPIRLTESEFAALVAEALGSLPEEFRARMENVSVEVHPLPARLLLRSMRLRQSDRQRLLGLYHGVPLTEKSVQNPVDWPERIYLFQRNIEAACRSRGEIVEQIRRTVLHEIGHHFGMTEQDLEDLDCG